MIEQAEEFEAERLPPWSDSYSGERRHRYQVCERLGEGAFGEVHRAVDLRSLDGGGAGRSVALKAVRGFAGGISRGAFREMQSLRRLRHPNVLRLLDVFPRESSVVLVLELAPSDLAEVLEQSPHPLPPQEVKAYAAMMLRGLGHVHKAGLLHRDIKPGNLLIDSNGVLKLADFGLARPYGDGRLLSFQVGTRMYRAPELLFSSRSYGPAVDVWAAGCVFAYMLNHRPLFPGMGDIDQMARIFRALGTPTPESWPGATDLPDFHKLHFKEMRPQPKERLFWGAGAAATAFAARLLTLDPERRISAAAALTDPYFFELPLAASAPELRKWPRRRGGMQRRHRHDNASNDNFGSFSAAEDPSTPPGGLENFSAHWCGQSDHCQ